MSAPAATLTEAMTPSLRRDFELPSEEMKFLSDDGYRWESVTIHDGSGVALWLLVLDVALPNGFVAVANPGEQVNSVTVGIRVTGYQTSALDMVYVHPPVTRADGAPIPGLTPLTIDGREFQQWSRHYAFQVGVDSIESHFRAAVNWFSRAVQR